MKYRNGFVSNSSSSSFIIAFKEKPSSPEELQKILFGKSEFYSSWDDAPVSTLDAAKQIYKDMVLLGKKSNAENFIEGMCQSCWSPPLKEIIEELGAGTPYGETSLKEPEYPTHSEYGSAKYKKEYDKYCSDQDLYLKDMANNFIKKTQGMLYFTVEYSDNDGNFFSTLEHGGTFDNIPYIRVSKH